MMAPSVAAVVSPRHAPARSPLGVRGGHGRGPSPQAAGAPSFVLTTDQEEQPSEPSAIEDTDSAIGGSTSTDKGNNR